MRVTLQDIAAGWHHLIAMHDGRQLKLFVDGKLVAQSTTFEPAEYDLSTDQPLRIGFGQTEYFAGQSRTSGCTTELRTSKKYINSHLPGRDDEQQNRN